MVTLRANSFAVLREVATSPWLGLAHHGQGLGTEARIGLLTWPSTTSALTTRSPRCSMQPLVPGFSRKLVYEPDGISRGVRDDQVVVSDRLRLTSARWRAWTTRARRSTDWIARAACSVFSATSTSAAEP